MAVMYMQIITNKTGPCHSVLAVYLTCDMHIAGCESRTVRPTFLQ